MEKRVTVPRQQDGAAQKKIRPLDLSLGWKPLACWVIKIVLIMNKPGIVVRVVGLFLRGWNGMVFDGSVHRARGPRYKVLTRPVFRTARALFGPNLY